MILELDCGNSYIKWRIVAVGVTGVLYSGLASSSEQLLEQLKLLPALALRRCRLVSVRSEEESLRLVGLLERAFGIECSVAKPAAEMAGVRNGYNDYRRLGMDRWLAILAAYQLAGGACLVIDVGTAVTSDLVAANGDHLGGYICPGVRMMRNELCANTQGIGIVDIAAVCALRDVSPGRTTLEAVERGSLLMLQGFVVAQLQLACEAFGADFQVFLTGGDAGLLGEMPATTRVIADLVFIGLEIACP